MSRLLKHPPLTTQQRSTFLACFLGWMLDAFDFFLLTLCLRSVAADFHVTLKQMTEAIFWTLVMRPVGALIFGAMAERFGRRPTLMVNVVSFSVFELLSAFAPNLGSFLILRALFGIAMGGEWGVGAALALEVLPSSRRGFFSGLLQEGYVAGNLLAAALYGLLFSHLHGTGLFAPWRVLFMIGALPAGLALYLRARVDESPAWLASRQQPRPEAARTPVFESVRRYLPSFLFLTLLMTAFTSFSHGTQDLYPAFLERDRGFSPGAVGLLVAVGNLGALVGGVLFGSMSERWGRRRAIVTASLLALPVIPLWMWSHTAALLGLGGFLMQFAVQGAWGVIPAHLNELSPAAVRAIFPGVAYQFGNLLSSRNGVFQAELAARYFGGRLAPVLAGTVVVVALLVAGLTTLGREDRGAALGSAEQAML